MSAMRGWVRGGSRSYYITTYFLEVCHPESVRQRRTEEGPYARLCYRCCKKELGETSSPRVRPWQSRAHRKVSLSPAFSVRVRDDTIFGMSIDRRFLFSGTELFPYDIQIAINFDRA
jgi:hypothetical protein